MYSPYPHRPSDSDLDLRDQLNAMFVSKKQRTPILYRRAIFDESGKLARCPCTLNNRSNEPDIDIRCSQCEGMGYKFKDYIVYGFINHSQAYAENLRFQKEGAQYQDFKTVYLEWDSLKKQTNSDLIPNRYDRIIQLEQDLAGAILSPSKIRIMYAIQSVDPYRLDNSGRIEYYRLRITSLLDKSFIV